MTAHSKMFKKIEYTRIGKLGNGQGVTRVSDYMAEGQLGSQKMYQDSSAVC